MTKQELPLPDLIGKVFSKKNNPLVVPKQPADLNQSAVASFPVDLEPHQNLKFPTVGFVMTPDLLWRKKTRRKNLDEIPAQENIGPANPVVP